MVAIPASVLVSACCHAIIMIGDNDQYECTGCMKPCKADGTLGEYYDRKVEQVDSQDDRKQ